MKLGLISILLTSLFLFFTSRTFAQSTIDAVEKSTTLRLQLLDVQDK